MWGSALFVFGREDRRPWELESATRGDGGREGDNHRNENPSDGSRRSFSSRFRRHHHPVAHSIPSPLPSPPTSATLARDQVRAYPERNEGDKNDGPLQHRWVG